MNISVGIDLAEQTRFRQVGRKYGGRFLGRIFTEQEIKKWPGKNRDRYAALGFSFKEAAWKALPAKAQKKTGFKDIEILWRKNQPALKIRDLECEYLLAWCVSRKFVVALVLFFWGMK